ncbi:MAG: PKD domain-containing protein [Pirellulales bacterium]
MDSLKSRGAWRRFRTVARRFSSSRNRVAFKKLFAIETLESRALMAVTAWTSGQERLALGDLSGNGSAPFLSDHADADLQSALTGVSGSSGWNDRSLPQNPGADLNLQTVLPADRLPTALPNLTINDDQWNLAQRGITRIDTSRFDRTQSAIQVPHLSARGLSDLTSDQTPPPVRSLFTPPAGNGPRPEFQGALQLWTLDSEDSDEWRIADTSVVFHEGDRIRVTGRFSDTSGFGDHVVWLQWGNGISTPGTVDEEDGSFAAEYVYADDFSALGISSARIRVDMQNVGGGLGTAYTRPIQVLNQAPVVSLQPKSQYDASSALFRVDVQDPGADSYVYHWVASAGSTIVADVIGTSPVFQLARTAAVGALLRLQVTVTDDEGGQGSYTTGLRLGSDGNDSIAVSDQDFMTLGVDTLTVLGLDGADLIDASAVSASHRVLVDGGAGANRILGGGGDDTFVVGDGDEVNSPSLATSNNATGNDRYVILPGAQHTVWDAVGDNIIDFSRLTFAGNAGVRFDLSSVMSTSVAAQDIAPVGADALGVSMAGRFTAVIGTALADQFTVGSGGSIYGGAGADRFYTPAGNLDTANLFGESGDDEFIVTAQSRVGSLSVIGGDGSDRVQVLGSVQNRISFEGDSGSDMLIIGSSNGTGVPPSAPLQIGSITFAGDEGSDTLIQSPGTSVGSLSFLGDDGNDWAVIAGTVTALTFDGGAGEDVLTGIERSTTSSTSAWASPVGKVEQLTFHGGADDDSLLGGTDLEVTTLSAGGDAGNDFVVIGSAAGSVFFDGGDGVDALVAGSSALSLTGAGQAAGSIHIGSIRFIGGNDDDVLEGTEEIDAARVEVDGDAGNDWLVFSGIAGSILFNGGLGADVFLAGSTSIWGGLGTPAAQSITAGTITFNGGADDDVLVGGEQIDVSRLEFEGDAGNDWLVFDGRAQDILFHGGLDDDALIGGTSADVNHLAGEGDTGDDWLIFHGTFNDLHFDGGAGEDVLVVGSSTLLGEQPSSQVTSVGTISFVGGADSDVLVGGDDVQINQLAMEGDAGDDWLVFNGNIQSVFFNGGDGEDGLVAGTSILSTGSAPTVPKTLNLGTIRFVGGNDDDFLGGSDGVVITRIEVDGDAGSDWLVFDGRADSVLFEGGTGADVVVAGSSAIHGWRPGQTVRPSIIGTLSFVGGADDDILVGGAESEAIDVQAEGDAGDDYLLLSGKSTTVHFDGGTGSDVFIVKGIADSIEFLGSDGDDALLNDADGVHSIVVDGGEGDDLVWNRGDSLSSIKFIGGLANDDLLNQGNQVASIRFDGNAGDDVFENSGSDVGTIAMTGGDGDDTLYQRAGHIQTLEFTAGSGNDVLGNEGAYIASLRMLGEDGDDRFLNNGDRIGRIAFVGGFGNDAIQSNGDHIDVLDVQGQAGSDQVFQNGSYVGSILFSGGDGSDTLINTGSFIQPVGAVVGTPAIRFDGEVGADTLEINGTSIGDIAFSGSLGQDSLIVHADTGSITFRGDEDNDVFILRGTAAAVSVTGGGGNDRFTFAGQSTSAALNGGQGDDVYELEGSPQGSLQIVESYTGAADSSQDLIDASGLLSGPLVLDLASTSSQAQSSSFTVRLSDVAGVENVIGSQGADIIFGNDRNNSISGAQYYAHVPVTTLGLTRGEQWVLLDFDTYTDANERRYADADRQRVLSKLSAVYYGTDSAGNPRNYSDPNRWFPVRFALSTSELPVAVRNSGSFATIYFNATPSYDSPGGESSEVDLMNRNAAGSARVQVNGLLNGVAEKTSLTSDFLANDEDIQVVPGHALPDGTDENFAALSAKIAAHELAHLLGVRHYDAFGPIGSGVHSPPGTSAFLPEYPGPASAYESFDHIIGSPATVGSTRFNDVGPLNFGEREAVKLTLAFTDLNALTQTEATTAHDSLLTAQPITLQGLSVPNTMQSGRNSMMNLYSRAAVITGSIALVGGRSQSDYYKFTGFGGDLVTVELASSLLAQGQGMIAGATIDSVVRLYDAAGRLVQTYGCDAVNDDEFESSDSLLLDVTLPADGTYTIEVDTFVRLPSDPRTLLMQDAIAQLQAMTDRSPEQTDLLQRLIDSRDDTDTGHYQLLLYTFGRANRVDGVDQIVGRGGRDQIDGGVGDSYALSIVGLPVTLSGAEGSAISSTVTLADRGGSNRTVRIDFGDGTAPYAVTTASLQVPWTHVYRDNGEYTVNVSVSNDDALETTGRMIVQVQNVAPTPAISSLTGQWIEGGSVIGVGTAFDPGGTTEAVTLSWRVTRNSQPTVTIATGTGSNLSFVPDIADTYWVMLTARDKDGGFATVAHSLLIAAAPNMVPQLSLQAPVDGIQRSADTFVFRAVDADALDRDRSFTYAIQWGDGTTSTVVGGSQVSIVKAYSQLSAAGSFTIQAVVTDRRGGRSDTLTSQFVVNGWSVLPDPLNSGKTILVIAGSQGSDEIRVRPDSYCTLELRIRDNDTGYAIRNWVSDSVDRILVYGFAGNDRIIIDSYVDIDTEIWGGQGSDVLAGGSGRDIIFGEQGDDSIYGGSGRDVLIGGTGADMLSGNDFDDVLIAGFTAFDGEFNLRGWGASLSLIEQRRAVEAIMSEWTSSNSYSQRIANLTGVGNNLRRNASYYLIADQTVFDDWQRDELWGDGGTDWFFANWDTTLDTRRDVIGDRNSCETRSDLDRW